MPGADGKGEENWLESGDPFLTHHLKEQIEEPPSRKPGATKGRFGWVIDALKGASLTIVPWAIFALVSCLFTLTYHHLPALVWLVVFFTVMGSLAILGSSAAKNQKVPDKPKDKTDKNSVSIKPVDSGNTALQFFMGTLCLVASVFASVLGYYNYHTNMFAYWSLEMNGEYFNVLPTQLAEAHADAGKIVFSDNTRVDTTRGTGYKNGAVYCVAPILDDVPVGKVQFWAVGTDCCAARADFNCDDAWSSKARSGVVVLDSNSWMPSQRDQYLQAIKIAESTFEIVSAKNPMLVRWVLDPEVIQDDYWRTGVGFLVAELSIYLLVSILFGGIGMGAVKRAAIL